ncbi:MAG TPA: phospholipase D-like domain-containing protein [Burkholderiaceae bacterium]|nr:phospholipase D-like domain-containing protein [Burkholderiaceae bacterium]
MIADHLWAIFLGLSGLFSLYSAGHALVNKRDPRSALGWVAVCLLFHPAGGAIMYWLFGVNRIRTTAQRWQNRGDWALHPEISRFYEIDSSDVSVTLNSDAAALLAVSDRLIKRPVVGGNHVTILHDGEEAYPAMLASIRAARRAIYLCTYIFHTDRTGQAFIDALGAAAARGVDVRVLVDGLGAFYSFPPPIGRLRAAGVRAAWFLPMTQGIHVNLRNHRKLLIVDTTTGFTGGMNIGDHHLAHEENKRHRVTDLHFQVDGPGVLQMEEVFLEDWHFAVSDSLPASVPPRPPATGRAFCRGISDGPNHDFEILHWVIIGVISAAKRRVQIMTPYFLPEPWLMSALTAAAFRGAEVEIVLPRQNNLPYVAWATQSLLWQLLQHDIRVYYQPPPFAHTKYLLIDDCYALVGSCNLDPRSLRLNFEFNLEICDEAAVSELGRHFGATRERSTGISLAEVDARPLPVKLRDATAKLFVPYL